MTGIWVPQDIRDQVVDYVSYWMGRTGLSAVTLYGWIGLPESTFYAWRKRYGRANEHNGRLPREFWLEEWEREAIIAFYGQHPLDGYRRIAFMMIDEDIVAVSPSSVYRVLKRAGLIGRRNTKPSKKGTGFVQPLQPHEHWHTDVSYININGTFYYLCGILDGCSRYMVHWEIREAMTEQDIEVIIQRAHEKFPNERPRIISDNGPQFIARDFKEFIRLSGMTHVRTSPYYPQSNGKIERWHKTIKSECIRPETPLTVDDARRVVQRYVEHYNTVRLHSAIGYVTPADRLAGRHTEVQMDRNRKLEEARARRIRNRNMGKNKESGNSRSHEGSPVAESIDVAVEMS
ncbi:MAG: transposase IS3/IS911 family protein [Magnetococcales bacterium]|nr:transposase IS3/IS911 family protein [Magnetococcales bacterium]